MPIAQPKKLGLDQMPKDTGLELRLRKIEQELLRKGEANKDAAPTNRLIPPSVIPDAPTGLALVGGIQTIRVIWDAVDFSNLRDYEIQVDTDQSFGSPDIFFSTLLNYDFVGAASGTTHFVRVRARTLGGIDGLFTGVLNTTTGQVQGDDIADGAITSTQLSSGQIGRAVVSFTDTSDTVIFGTFKTFLTTTFTPSDVTSQLVVMCSYAMAGLVNAALELKIVNETSASNVWSEVTIGHAYQAPDTNRHQATMIVATDSPASTEEQTYTLQLRGTFFAGSAAITDRTLFVYEIIP